MKLSVITVCYNAARTIRETAASVQALGDAIHEYVVIDGASDDGTLEILAGMRDGFGGRLRVLSEPDEGIYDAMNKGIAAAEGEWIVFLGADDLLLPGALQLAAYEPPQGVDLVCCDVELALMDGRTRIDRCEDPRRIGHLPRELPICHQGMAVSLEAYRELGGFDSSFRIAADYEFYLRFAASGRTWIRLPALIARFAHGGLSSTALDDTADEYRRARVAHGLPAAHARAAFTRSRCNARIADMLRRRGIG